MPSINNYPVTGLTGKIQHKKNIKHQTSPPCRNCRYDPNGLSEEKCDTNKTFSSAPYCSTFEPKQVSEKVKERLE